MLMNTTFLGDSFSIKWQSRVVGGLSLLLKLTVLLFLNTPITAPVFTFFIKVPNDAK